MASGQVLFQRFYYRKSFRDFDVKVCSHMNNMHVCINLLSEYSDGCNIPCCQDRGDPKEDPGRCERIPQNLHEKGWDCETRGIGYFEDSMYIISKLLT